MEVGGIAVIMEVGGMPGIPVGGMPGGGPIMGGIPGCMAGCGILGGMAG